MLTKLQNKRLNKKKKKINVKKRKKKKLFPICDCQYVCMVLCHLSEFLPAYIIYTEQTNKQSNCMHLAFIYMHSFIRFVFLFWLLLHLDCDCVSK